MRFLCAAFASLIVIACVHAPTKTEKQTEPVTAAPVIAAERAFAAHAAEVGWVQAFRVFVAPDGVLLTGELANATETLAQATDTGDTTLAWWPAYAGIARSGDFGFTTGPVLSGASTEVGMHYFTVWRRQPDGDWKWIFDGGVGVTDPAPFPRTQMQVPTLAPATGGAGSATAAIAQVQNLERTHATAIALLPLLAETARINRHGLAPAIGRQTAATMFANPAPEISYAPLRAEASSAGDLVMTINEARWSINNTDRRGHAVRIWQWQEGVWRIVFDELVPARARPS